MTLLKFNISRFLVVSFVLLDTMILLFCFYAIINLKNNETVYIGIINLIIGKISSILYHKLYKGMIKNKKSTDESPV